MEKLIKWGFGIVLTAVLIGTMLPNMQAKRHGSVEDAALLAIANLKDSLALHEETSAEPLMIFRAKGPGTLPAPLSSHYLPPGIRLNYVVYAPRRDRKVAMISLQQDQSSYEYRWLHIYGEEFDEKLDVSTSQATE